VYACGALITPFIGSFTDLFGLRAILNVVAAGAITGVHAVLAFTSFYPALPLVFLGAAYSLYAAALWPCVALVIEPKHQATAYGLVTAVQNLGQAIAPLGIAALMPDARCSTFQTCVDGWDNVERLFVWIGCAGVGCGIILNIVDRFVSKHPVLNESNAALVKRQKEEEAAAIEQARLPLLEAGKGEGY
jgi:MFS family permease